MKLEDIGFYTLSDDRAENVSVHSELQRCELILTSRCNFNCPYCRGMKNEDKGDMSYDDASHVVELWASDKLKNIRFSGGEPTLWPRLVELVSFAKERGIERVALSTNGSADFEIYEGLAKAGVNDFSISLDSCCASTGDKMAGNLPIWDKVVDNIKRIAEISYTTVGVVLTEENQGELQQIIEVASSLGVADVRIIPAAQVAKKHKGLTCKDALEAHPILKYRVENFLGGKSVRGLTKKDNNRCPLVLDDMAVLNGKHYPCIIYMREHGQEIGKVNGSIKNIRAERMAWFESHDCYKDDICRNNCLDVCVDYNNKVRATNSHLYA